MSRLARRAAALLRATALAELQPPRAASAWARTPAVLGEARAWHVAAPWGGASPRGFAAAAGGGGDEGDAEEEADVSHKVVLRKHTELALRLAKEEERRGATARGAPLPACLAAEKHALTRRPAARAGAQRRKGGGVAAHGTSGENAPGAGGGGRAPQRQRDLLERLEGMSRKQQQYVPPSAPCAAENLGRRNDARADAPAPGLRLHRS
jgi:hypothetical protein